MGGSRNEAMRQKCIFKGGGDSFIPTISIYCTKIILFIFFCCKLLNTNSLLAKGQPELYNIF